MKKAQEWVGLIAAGFLVYTMLLGVGYILGLMVLHLHWWEVLLGVMGGMFIVKTVRAEVG